MHFLPDAEIPEISRVASEETLQVAFSLKYV